jgi:hypothetical protein
MSMMDVHAYGGIALQVSLWDTRSSSHRAMGRIQSTPHATLHALAVSTANPHLLAAAGSQRGVTCYDVRIMRAMQRAHSSKWDITQVSFLDGLSNLCLAAGLDQEVTLGLWESSAGQVGR